MPGSERKRRRGDAVSLPCPFRAPAGIGECLVALRAHRRRRYADQAFHKVRVGVRGAAQSSDIRAANLADTALRRGPPRDRRIDHGARLLAWRGHPGLIGVEAGLQARTELDALAVSLHILAAGGGKL